MKKRRIVLASVLKPVDDTRMFEKMGGSLAGIYEVHIVGYPGSARLPEHGDVFVYPLRPFRRISLGRLLAPWRILARVVALQPAVFVFCTHELIFVALLARLLTSCRLVYDVRENYYRNILYTAAFPRVLRPLVAGYVRVWEHVGAGFIHNFLLAEKGYALELSFGHGRRTIIENKLRRPPAVAPAPRLTPARNFLFTGTLSEITGLFTALDLLEQLHRHDPAVRGTIIGYCALVAERQSLRARLATMPYVTLHGGDRLVPHPAIEYEILRADVGIVAYPPNPATEHSFPTKLYEYLGYRLPILLIDYAPWVTYAARFDAAVTFQPASFDAPRTLQQLRGKTFYSAPPEDVFWEHEGERLRTVIDALVRR
jgi:glycosyltransferase involved in cell wall biosynthesis